MRATSKKYYHVRRGARKEQKSVAPPQHAIISEVAKHPWGKLREPFDGLDYW